MERKQRQRPFPPDKCPKVWEKARRAKFKGVFEELSQLLPKHDPSAPLSRMKVVQGALSYIRDLQAQNEDLLNGGFDEVHKKKIESWKRRVKELLCRVDQLTEILRTAKIHVPPLALETIPTWTKARPKLWTEKVNIPEGKIEEVFERIAQAKRKKRSAENIETKGFSKKEKKTAEKKCLENAVVSDTGSKENLPTPTLLKKSNSTTKGKKGAAKVAVVQNVTVPQSDQSMVSVSLPSFNQPPGILHGSVVTPIAPPNTYILTNQGNLVPVLTPNPSLLAPVIINRPPVLVVQQPPALPSQKPVICAGPPANKVRISRESTVMTFVNKIPISALSNNSHTRKGGKCAAHKNNDRTKMAAQISDTPLVTASQVPTTVAVSAIVEVTNGDGPSTISIPDKFTDGISTENKALNSTKKCSEKLDGNVEKTGKDNISSIINESQVCVNETLENNSGNEGRIIAKEAVGKQKEITANNFGENFIPLLAPTQDVIVKTNVTTPAASFVADNKELSSCTNITVATTDAIIFPALNQQPLLFNNEQKQLETISEKGIPSIIMDTIRQEVVPLQQTNTGNSEEAATFTELPNALLTGCLPPPNVDSTSAKNPDITIERRSPLKNEVNLVQDISSIANKVTNMESKTTLSFIASNSPTVVTTVTNTVASTLAPREATNPLEILSKAIQVSTNGTNIPSATATTAISGSSTNSLQPLPRNVSNIPPTTVGISAITTQGACSTLNLLPEIVAAKSATVPVPAAIGNDIISTLEVSNSLKLLPAAVETSKKSTYIPLITSTAAVSAVTSQEAGNSLKLLPEAIQVSSNGVYLPPTFTTSLTFTSQQCGNPTVASTCTKMVQTPSSYGISSSQVSWPPINALKPHLPVPTSDNSWFVSSTKIQNDQGKPPPPSLPPSSSSWRPLPNDVFWNSSGENWSLLNANKETTQSGKKSKHTEKAQLSAKTIPVSGNEIYLNNVNTTFQWPVTASNDASSGQIGLYPFSTAGNPLYSTPMPVSEPSWVSNESKQIQQGNTLTSTNVLPTPSTKIKTAQSITAKTSSKGHTYYAPAIGYLPPTSNYCSQEFHKDSFYTTSKAFSDTIPVTTPASVQGSYSKSSSKQGPGAPAKTYSNISNLVSSRQPTAVPKPIVADLPNSKQILPASQQHTNVSCVSAPTYIASTSKVAVSESFYPTCHYSVADNTLYNPFSDPSYTSTLLKQTLPENFVNAYSNEVTYSAGTAPYPLGVTKTLLSEPPYSLSALKTSMAESYYPGVPVYSGSIPNVISSEPLLYPSNANPQQSNLLKVSCPGTLQPPTTTQSSSAPTVSHSTSTRKMSQNDKTVQTATKPITQGSIVGNAISSTYPITKSHEPMESSIASFTTLSNVQKSDGISVCHAVSSAPLTKTSQPAPLWNSSYFPAIQTGPEGTTPWSQMEYCLGDSKDTRPKPPINWMTDPESRSDGICPSEDPFQPRFVNTFDRKDQSQASQAIFEYCIPVPEDDSIKNKNRKKEVEPAGQDYYGWAPMKVDPLVVPGTLPTLVGDLALGGDPVPTKRNKTASFNSENYAASRCGKETDLNPLPQEPFTNLSKNIFDFSQNDIQKSSMTAETIVLKNIFELPAASMGKQKPSQGPNSFLSVSQLVDTHNMESNTDKNEYSYSYHQKSGKAKRSSGWKCNEKKCIQSGKSCSNYSAEALLRSQDTVQPEPDFCLQNNATFQMDFPHDTPIMDTTDLISGQVVNKPKTYSPRHRKQECWKGQDFRQAPAIAFSAGSAPQPFNPTSGKTSGKVLEPPLPFPYLPENRLPAPLPPSGSTSLPFPRFPSNPPAPLLPTSGFSQQKSETVPFASMFPPSPGRPCGPPEGNIPHNARYPGSRKPYNYPRSSKANFSPFSPSFSNEPARKPSSKAPVSAPQSSNPTLTAPMSVPPSNNPFITIPPQPSVPSGSSLANFNLSTIFPEINKKGNYQYP